MHRIPFLIGNTLAGLVYGSDRRSRFRGWTNLILFRPWIARFIRREYGERIKSLRFVRQRTLNRVVGIVNDKYYIKIFRNVTNRQIRDFIELMNIVQPAMHVEIPHVVVDKTIPMYACQKNNGKLVSEFDKEIVIQNQDKIFAQVHDIISQLQSIDVEKIPNNERYITNMQRRRRPQVPCDATRRVLGHFDMNPYNFLFDDKLNIVAVIDWDAISIATNPDTDWSIFVKNWSRYLGK